MVRKFLDNCRKPKGFIGRMLVSGMNNGHANVGKWGLSFLKIKKDAKALDIGCGGGATISRLLEICSLGTVYGIDYSKDSVKVSRKKNAAALGKRCEIIQGSVSSLPYANESFDAVTAFETVYFWPDIANDFAKVYRVLKPGGKFLVCNEMCDPSDTTWSGKIDGMTIYSPKEIEKLLISNGFSIEYSENKKTKWVCVVAQK